MILEFVFLLRDILGFLALLVVLVTLLRMPKVRHGKIHESQDCKSQISQNPNYIIWIYLYIYMYIISIPSVKWLV